MWRKALVCAGVELNQLLRPWRYLASRSSTSVSSAAAVNSILLRSLKDHYLEVSKMTAPPKVSPPSPFTVMKGALDSGGAVLKRTYGDEEISISVMRLANIIPGGSGDDNDDDGINQLFLHVDISKPGQKESLHFLCGLYPDALGIHSVSMRPKADSSGIPCDSN
ncbi:Mitochondrial glycoprotein family protein [Abeliophyllum distichum]|uniref:Mitochondrial glycoprotein family protein n=1 Tax=Abeliophyllum distichum TaxID=126358 RepID=A0ABD1VTD2_9LAMI